MTCWLLDADWPRMHALALPTAAPVQRWQSLDDQLGRAYLHLPASAQPPGEGWVALQPLLARPGASAIETPDFHYTVEADVAPEHEADFNAWYDTEHLPGLAAVPGAVLAQRFRRLSGAPRYIAAYDLTSTRTLERAEWLAVRHTDWSSRVRPTFLNPRRTMFKRA